MTLTEFLLARIAEDEDAAQSQMPVLWGDGHMHSPDGGLIIGDPARGALSPARVLAECEVKRRIVESVERTRRAGTNGLGPSVLVHLAAIYADHPDYRDEWKP